MIGNFPIHHVYSPSDSCGISIDVVIDIEGVSTPNDLVLIDIDDIIYSLKTLEKYYQNLYDKKARETSPDWS